MWRVTTRRSTDQLVATPVGLTAAPLSAHYIGEARTQLLSPQIIEITRDFEVLAQAADFGHQRGEVTITCADSSALSQAISWEYLPPLTVSPRGLTVSSSDSHMSKTITLSSSDRGFKILALSPSPNVIFKTTYSHASQRLHQINLDFEPRRIEPGSPCSIRIKTDHPLQPDLVFSILILGDSQETRR